MSKDVSKNSGSLVVDQVFMLNKQFFIKKTIVARSVSLGVFFLFVIFAINLLSSVLALSKRLNLPAIDFRYT